jgi:hypothetical protein
MIPGVLLFECCKDIILNRLAPTISWACFPFNVQILIELPQTGRFRLPEGMDASCKNIIPGDLLCSLRKSINTGHLVLTGSRSGYSRDLACGLARSECLRENMTCASLSARIICRRTHLGVGANAKAPQTYLSRTYNYFTAGVNRGRCENYLHRQRWIGK